MLRSNFLMTAAVNADYEHGASNERSANKTAACQINKKVLPLSFGISEADLKRANAKLQSQRLWLKSQIYKVDDESGEIKTLLDCSYSANFSSRYYAELNNRVNTINDFSFNQGLQSSFLTITLNGCFRDALMGDFNRFKAKDRDLLSEEFKYKMKNCPNDINIKDLINLLNYQWNLFIVRIHRKYKNLTKYYIRSFEPHKKDGVPHIHALISYPQYAHEYILKAFKDIFYAPQNLRQNYLTKEQIAKGEINGFQWTLSNPTGYILKYINKTFINFNERDNLDYNTAWYVKYKVRRFISSKHQIPLWIYRKINFFYKDFYNLCSIKSMSEWHCEWNFDETYFLLQNIHSGETISCVDGVVKHSIGDNIIHYYYKEKPQDIDRIYRVYEKPTIKNRSSKIWFESKPIVTNMKDYTLLSYYRSLDTNTCNLQHFAYVENELVKRKMGIFCGKNRLNDLNAVFENLAVDSDGVIYYDFK